MKLFWGLYETHEHTFDATKWKSVTQIHFTLHDLFTDTIQNSGVEEYYQNTCLGCGDIIERKMERGRI